MRLLGAILLATVGGCFDVTGPAPGPFGALPADRGTAVGSTNPLSSNAPVWSGTQLYFERQAGPPWTYGIQSANPATQSTRTVLDLGANGVRGMAVTPDGEWAFFSTRSTAPGSTGALLLRRMRLPDGPVDTIAQLTPYLMGTTVRVAPAMRLSPDGAQLAYVREADSLFVLSVASGTSRFVTTNCRGVAAFSPSGSQVICGSVGGEGQYATVDLTNGARAPLVYPGENLVGDIRAFRWDANGVSVLHRSFTVLALTHLQTGATRTVFGDSTKFTLNEGMDDLSADWSADGNVVGVWRWQCVRSTGLFSCDMQFLLTLIDLRDSSSRHIAVVPAPDGANVVIGAIALSADGRMAAYQTGGQMYVKQAP